MSLPPRNAEHGCDSVDEVFKKFSVDRFAGYEDPEVQGAEQHFEQQIGRPGDSNRHAVRTGVTHGEEQ